MNDALGVIITMSDTESSIEALIKELKNVNNRINILQVTINDINTKTSENVVMYNALHEFMARFSSNEIELLKPATAKKTSKKSKKKVDMDTIKDLEFEPEEKLTSNYNTFVTLVKDGTEFAHKIASTWSSEDPSIVNDPKQIDYATFYNTYISSKVPKDNIPKSIKRIRKIVADKREEMKEEESK